MKEFLIKLFASWGLNFQDNDIYVNIIMCYLAITLLIITWMMITIIKIFANRKSSILHKYMNHGALIELIWTITPAVILILIGFPTFKLWYLMDEVIDPFLVKHAEGHQWYWSYKYPTIGDLKNSNIHYYQSDEEMDIDDPSSPDNMYIEDPDYPDNPGIGTPEVLQTKEIEYSDESTKNKYLEVKEEYKACKENILNKNSLSTDSSIEYSQEDKDRDLKELKKIVAKVGVLEEGNDECYGMEVGTYEDVTGYYIHDYMKVNNMLNPTERQSFVYFLMDNTSSNDFFTEEELEEAKENLER